MISYSPRILVKASATQDRYLCDTRSVGEAQGSVRTDFITSWYGVAHYAIIITNELLVDLSRQVGLRESKQCEVKVALGDIIEFFCDAL